jgi:hypothetical protein
MHFSTDSDDYGPNEDIDEGTYHCYCIFQIHILVKVLILDAFGC